MRACLASHFQMYYTFEHKITSENDKQESV